MTVKSRCVFTATALSLAMYVALLAMSASPVSGQLHTMAARWCTGVWCGCTLLCAGHVNIPCPMCVLRSSLSARWILLGKTTLVVWWTTMISTCVCPVVMVCAVGGVLSPLAYPVMRV